MNRAGVLLTSLMLLAAQVPLVACPCADIGGLAPALAFGAGDDHGHTHGHRHPHSHAACHAHHAHAHGSHPVRSRAPQGPLADVRDCVHDVLMATLLANARRAELPVATLDATPARASSTGPGLEILSAREGAPGLEPPPPRPPSATCLEDNVRLLS